MSMSKKISNPYSTGGGGVSFEHRVGGIFLIYLLTQDKPPWISCTRIEKIKFQARDKGALFDDLIIYGVEKSRSPTYSVQLKTRLQISERDEDFKQIISDAWNTFCGNTDFGFISDRDFIVIGLGLLDDKTRHLIKIISKSRANATAQDFANNIFAPSYSSAKERLILNMLQKMTSSVNNSEVEMEKLWSFLQRWVLFEIDTEDNGRDLTNSVRILSNYTNSDFSSSVLLLDRLYSIAAELARLGGSITHSQIRKRLESYLVIKSNPISPVLNSYSDVIMSEYHSKIRKKAFIIEKMILTYYEIFENRYQKLRQYIELYINDPSEENLEILRNASKVFKSTIEGFYPSVNRHLNRIINLLDNEVLFANFTDVITLHSNWLIKMLEPEPYNQDNFLDFANDFLEDLAYHQRWIKDYVNALKNEIPPEYNR
jgi:hypothetical protein